jgi:hypothetical protein
MALLGRMAPSVIAGLRRKNDRRFVINHVTMSAIFVNMCAKVSRARPSDIVAMGSLWPHKISKVRELNKRAAPWWVICWSMYQT